MAQTLLETLIEEFDHHVTLFDQKLLPLLRGAGSYGALVVAIQELHSTIRTDLLAARAGAEADLAGLTALFQEHADLERNELVPLLSMLWSLNRQGLDDLPRLTDD